MYNNKTYDETLKRKVLYNEPIIIAPLTLAEVVEKKGSSSSFYSQFINDVNKRITFSYKLHQTYGNVSTLILRSIFKNKSINEHDMQALDVKASDIMALF
jgi:hypothetical protein